MSMHDVSQLPVMDGTNCVGSVSDWSLSARSLDNTKVLDATVSEVMDAPFPVVDVSQSVDSVAKLLSKSNPAVLVRDERLGAGNRDSVRRAELPHGALAGGGATR